MEFTIVIKEKSLSEDEELPEAFIKRIKKSADEIQAGKGISFTMEEFEDYLKE